ncbi:circularly permuted type 2 ATP-grasp protein [Thermithiobacillus plumbiphilus]|uniref:Circularly permuted type 2 ATP-grasp protein n=1 Tax=Thermithiobacillus plumbiphilus TaxID=1729899 RepID=A0ABU9D866_9PROT
MNCTDYPSFALYDELIQPDGRPRPAARPLCDYLDRLSAAEILERRQIVDAAIMTMGITFTVYSDGDNIDRALPFDLVPCILTAREWRRIDAGLRQRQIALNLFIDDIYHDQRIIRDGVFPAELLHASPNFRPACQGVSPPFGAWAHVCGTDLVRDRDGTHYVLEDNLRVPSGVSYLLENRLIMKRLFPELFKSYRVAPVDDYSAQLFEMLCTLSPRPGDTPRVAVLTPGIYNSAYFEHSYLAQQMGAVLVEGRDLLVGDDDCVYMRTIAGLKRIDVIYRRIDDDFLDPEVFRPDSMLGVPGLMRAWRQGKVGIANAPGAGMADDKAVYAYVPAMIRYYLDQDAILPNVPSFLCFDEQAREHVLANLDKLVVKPANESGGYGMLIGPHASVEERENFRQRILANPRNYIAQPTLSLSTVPTFDGDRLMPRHIDIRPFILQARDQYVTPGGMCRVALKPGSLVVNSSQGGGSKDTWIVDLEGEADAVA